MHGPECPLRTRSVHIIRDEKGRISPGSFVPYIHCQCVACHCPEFTPSKNEAGACGNCKRPLIKNGKVIRVYA